MLPGATTVAVLMHPRQDFSHHVLVPELLARGFAVWTQGTRTGHNDLALLHEQAMLDMAAGHVFLRDNGFDQVVSVGHSGGGALAAFYIEQAVSLPHNDSPPPRREAGTLAEAEMPVPDALMLMAPHPGQGELLLRMIDPSVTDESDPLSVESLNPYSRRTDSARRRRPRTTPTSSSPPTGPPSTGASSASTPSPGNVPSHAKPHDDSAKPRTREADGRRWPRG